MVAPHPHRSTFAPAFWRGVAGIVAAVTSSCATLPPPSYPEFEELHLRAHYVIPANGRLQIPATTRELVVQRLILTPPPHRESFAADGTRFAHYPHGGGVVLRTRLRSYHGDESARRTPADLLPGADRIETLPWIDEAQQP